MPFTLPSFIIILRIVASMKNPIKNKYLQAVLRGIKPYFIGIGIAMGIYLVISSLVPDLCQAIIDWRGLLLTVVLFAVTIGYQKVKRKGLSPILLIILSAGIGMVVYTI